MGGPNDIAAVWTESEMGTNESAASIASDSGVKQGENDRGDPAQSGHDSQPHPCWRVTFPLGGIDTPYDWYRPTEADRVRNQRQGIANFVQDVRLTACARARS